MYDIVTNINKTKIIFRPVAWEAHFLGGSLHNYS